MLFLLTLSALAAPPELPTARNELFAASGHCSQCHTLLHDSQGEPVSPDTTWRGTMMANSARDPYWRATVAAEVKDLPDLAPLIEARCATCHTPMATTTEVSARRNPTLLGGGYLSAEHELHELAMDGVSCTLCHQIKPFRLGEEATFSGAYLVDTKAVADQRRLHGPNRIPFGPREMMRAVSGFDPIQGRHLGQAGLCATCHTLYTPFVDARGEVVGELPEQTPFLEWRASDWPGSRTCQDCHMPASDFGGRPYLVHDFQGGSTWVPLVLAQADPEALELAASPEHFQAASERARAWLESQAATLSVEEVAVTQGTLEARVVVTNTAGHKLPTGFPSRRAWLHLAVRDASGAVVFESGAPQADGSIDGNDNDEDPSRYEPHHSVLSAPDQVQVYEPVLADVDGAVTTRLLRAASYAKDNRLLPRGMDKSIAHTDIAPRGVATEDADFDAGGDILRLAVPVSGQGPYTVEARLLYQAIGERWAREIEVLGEGPKRRRVPEAQVFAELASAVPNEPVVLASATANSGD